MAIFRPLGHFFHSINEIIFKRLQETRIDVLLKRDRSRLSRTAGVVRGETAGGCQGLEVICLIWEERPHSPQATVKDWKCCARTKEILHEAVRVWRWYEKSDCRSAGDCRVLEVLWKARLQEAVRDYERRVCNLDCQGLQVMSEKRLQETETGGAINK